MAILMTYSRNIFKTTASAARNYIYSSFSDWKDVCWKLRSL